MKDLQVEKGYSLPHNLRATQQDLPLSINDLNYIPPTIVGELVAHTIKTMEKHCKKIAIRTTEPELILVNHRRLGESEFETWDLDIQRYINAKILI